VRDIAAGEPFTPENIRSIRPGHGLAPKHWDDVITRHASRALKRGDPLAMDMIDWRTHGAST
jgi:sialic acid synthase SpsE